MSFQTGVGQRTAVVTGCASPRGIGFAVARRYTQEGWAVAMLDINEDALKIAAEKVKSEFGQPVLAIPCNIGDKPSVDAAAKAVKESNLPPVGAIANVAGIPSPSSFLELSLEEWNRVYAINCTGSFLVCQAFIPQMIAGG